MNRPKSGRDLSRRISASILLFTTVLAATQLASAAPTTIPASTRPSTPITQAQRDADVKVVRSWWYAGTKQADGESMARLKAWTDSHPDDAEAVFFMVLGLRANPRFELDSSTSLALMERAANSGFAPAKARYALMLIGQNWGEPTDPIDAKKGKELLEQGVAAGDADALMSNGFLCHRGEGGYKKNLQMARRLYEKAAQAGFTRVFVYLGSIDMQHGLEEPAVAWFEKGIASGDISARLALAGYQMYRAKSPADKAAAFAAVKKIVEEDPSNGSAHEMLADYYYYSKGTPKDFDKFLQHQTLAWECGDSSSGMYLAKINIEGNIAGANPARGLQILRLLVKKKYATAETYMARLMLQGILVERDVAEAKRLMGLAAAHGDEDAKVYLKWFSSAQVPEAKPEKQ